tara:strand:+ start:1816 stop:2223 length:408 start_codon:yes stop_codon:yes gene_type:complete
MPKGASKGFTVWTKSNDKWISNLLNFLLEKEFVTAHEIHAESIKTNINDNKDTTQRNGIWGMRPNIHQIMNLLNHKLTWVVESNKVLVTANKGANKSQRILWELSPDWKEKYIEYQTYMMNRADRLKEEAGAKWK